jgi:hypothetical protein
LVSVKYYNIDKKEAKYREKREVFGFEVFSPIFS